MKRGRFQHMLLESLTRPYFNCRINVSTASYLPCVKITTLLQLLFRTRMPDLPYLAAKASLCYHLVTAVRHGPKSDFAVSYARAPFWEGPCHDESDRAQCSSIRAMVTRPSYALEPLRPMVLSIHSRPSELHVYQVVSECLSECRNVAVSDFVCITDTPRLISSDVLAYHTRGLLPMTPGKVPPCSPTLPGRELRAIRHSRSKKATNVSGKLPHLGVKP